MKKNIFQVFAVLVLMSLFSLSAMAEVVNLNKADVAALQQNLAGIGAVKAKAIVTYRKKNGNFKSIADLQNVPGIGPGTIKKNKANISLTKGVVKGTSKASSKKTSKTTSVKTKSNQTKTKTSQSKSKTKTAVKQKKKKVTKPNKEKKS